MAGWAGWRGKDTIGSVFLYFNKQKLYFYQDLTKKLEELMTKPTEQLQSKFWLTYKIIMFTLASQAGQSLEKDNRLIKDLMRKSFFENESQKERQFYAERLQHINNELSWFEDIESLTYSK